MLSACIWMLALSLQPVLMHVSAPVGCAAWTSAERLHCKLLATANIAKAAIAAQVTLDTVEVVLALKGDGFVRREHEEGLKEAVQEAAAGA